MNQIFILVCALAICHGYRLRKYCSGEKCLLQECYDTLMKCPVLAPKISSGMTACEVMEEVKIMKEKKEKTYPSFLNSITSNDQVRQGNFRKSSQGDMPSIQSSDPVSKMCYGGKCPTKCIDEKCGTTECYNSLLMCPILSPKIQAGMDACAIIDQVRQKKN